MQRESAAEYLARHRFRSFLEWISAEVVFARPDDPVDFVHELLAQKKDEVKTPQNIKQVLDACYSRAGSITTAKTLPAEKEEEGETEMTLTERLALLEKLISASRAMAMKLDPFEATECIIRESCKLLEADRATLFKLDEANNQLELMVAKEAKAIFLPVGQGIAGSVAATGNTINIPEAYDDNRFNPDHDKRTGYRTRSILCTPVKNGEGRIVGVIQAINKMSGVFSEVDEEVIAILAAQAGIALHNAHLYEISRRAQEKVQAMLEIVRMMHSDISVHSLMFTITERAHALVDADRCTLFLLDRNKEELWSMQGEVNIRIPMSKGIAGAVATTGDPINIVDAYKDDRFNRDVDRATGYRTTCILCLPIKCSEGTVIGVIQFINKRDGAETTYFAEEDEAVMSAFLTIAGPMLQNSQLFQRAMAVEKEGTEFTGVHSKHRKIMAPPSSIMEEDDEEEEEEDDEFGMGM